MRIKEIKVVLKIEGQEARALDLCVGHYLEDMAETTPEKKEKKDG